jgi:hypothetical protein
LSLAVYFDDSGSSTPQAVGGALATRDVWSAFDERWKALLSDLGVTWIHSADLTSATRDELSRRLIDICRDNPISFLGNTVPNHAIAREEQAEDETEYSGKENAWAKEGNRLIRSPYCRALAACLIDALVREAMPRRETLDIFLANQAGEVGNAVLLLEWLKFIPELAPWVGTLHQGPTQNPRTVLPLQLADIVAYEVWRAINERNRPLYLALKSRPHYFGTSTRLLDRWVRARMC